MKFEDVIGQEEVKERLLQMVREDRVPHALLLCGPSGSGKLALATAFACHLIAESTRRPSLMGMEIDPQAEAMLAKLEHPDLHFSYPTIKTPSMGSEDFAYYLEKVPGAFFRLGTGDERPESHIGLHNPKHLFSEKAIPTGVITFVGAAYKLTGSDLNALK